MDEVAEEVEKVKKEFEEASKKVEDHINSIQEYGKTGVGLSSAIAEEKSSLPRLNGVAQDSLNLLQSLQFKLDLLAPQLPTDDQVQDAKFFAESWKKLIHSLRLSLRNANLQAKANTRKAAQEERELLLGGGGESTIRRRNLQTKAGMTSTAEGITESLRRTRQMMIQEVERSESTLMTFEESTGVLRKAESEYKGHRSLLMRTRNLLSTMQRQDVIDRVILVVGFLLFALAALYVVSKRIGLLKLQRKVMEAVKSGMAGQVEIVPRAGGDGGANIVQIQQNVVPTLNVLDLIKSDEVVIADEDGKRCSVEKFRPVGLNWRPDQEVMADALTAVTGPGLAAWEARRLPGVSANRDQGSDHFQYVPSKLFHRSPVIKRFMRSLAQEKRPRASTIQLTARRSGNVFATLFPYWSGERFYRFRSHALRIKLSLVHVQPFPISHARREATTIRARRSSRTCECTTVLTKAKMATESKPLIFLTPDRKINFEMRLKCIYPPRKTDHSRIETGK
nr:uncharacterized protein LOC109165532 [Ipomoea trifida]